MEDTFWEDAGPWLTTDEIADRLGVANDEVDRLRVSGHAFAVRWLDGTYGYPDRQLTEDQRILPELSAVLRAAAGMSDAWISGWLACAAWKNDVTTRWDVLASEESALVARWMADDVAWIRRP
ncbi:hypothetical protein [Leifsonia sp. Leaf264]|uniref:hypothetical protein n=1 Tax=Leifsonia sp. Leaf264 TaxID=1736314 RepID=UPI0006F777FC|nr:hypothetical protein [Leifsonia sp. Leaf264]KQP01375.1 hypothetical protein ASF30_01805 [Leifsonia sp. Leaf264]